MTELAGANGTAAEALRFLIFTVCRMNEALGARWTEIDRSRAIWSIPADHSVPLSDPALAILDKMRVSADRSAI
jgi:integrase